MLLLRLVYRPIVSRCRATNCLQALYMTVIDGRLIFHHTRIIIDLL